MRRPSLAADAIDLIREDPQDSEAPEPGLQSVADLRSDFEALLNGLEGVKGLVVFVDDVGSLWDVQEASRLASG